MLIQEHIKPFNPINIPPNLKEVATKGFVVLSCTISCGEQHIKSE